MQVFQRDKGTKKLNWRPLPKMGERETTMTQREFLTAVSNNNINDEIIDFAKAEIEKMDARNEKRKTTPSKTALANEPIKEEIIKVLTERGTMCAADVGELVAITTQKASSLLRQLVEDGKVKSEDKKVPKKGSVKFYSIA